MLEVDFGGGNGAGNIGAGIGRLTAQRRMRYTCRPGAEIYMVFELAKWPKWPQGGPDMAQIGPKVAQKWPKAVLFDIAIF